MHPDKRPRGGVLNVYLTAHEYEQVERMAAEKNVSKGSVLKEGLALLLKARKEEER